MFRLIVGVAACLLLAPLQAADATPFQAQLEALQEALLRHRRLAAAGGWPAVPAGPTIRPGSDDPRLETLAARLVVSGDLSADEIAYSYYDESMQDAVRRFQNRHGLEADGLVGRRTLRALNVPVERRIDQIFINLDRAGSLSDVDERDLILVNIPAFKATIFRGGKALWTTKVIVGEEEDETPEFRSEVTSVVLNPTWSVPYSIASEEFLPKMKQDPGFFSNGGYELYDRDGDRVDPTTVDWAAYSTNNFPFRLVQRPGPMNQLGEIKFVMPNPYSVCLHDTPSRELFANASRAFSHGCIRVDDPLTLAETVLDDDGWTREQIESQLGSGKTRSIGLSRALPVYVVYWTAEVDDNGETHFYNDIYGKDQE